jgi:hypothetical protein
LERIGIVLHAHAPALHLNALQALLLLPEVHQLL